MIRKSALALTFLLVAAGCDRSPEPNATESGSATLAGGAFLPRDPWLDVVTLYHAQRAAKKQSEAWRVPYRQWIEVEDGWGGAEDWGGWGLGQRTRLRFFLHAPGDYDFFIEAMAPPATDKRPQEVTVRINGRPAAALTVGSDWEEHRFAVAPDVLRRGWNDLELAYGYHLDGSLETDSRPLALAFERLGLIPPGHEPSPSGSGPGFRFFEQQEVLVLEAPGAYVVPLDVPRHADVLELDVHATREKGAMGLEVRIVTVEGREETLGRFPDEPTPDDSPLRLPLDSYRGSQVLLVFDANLPPGGRFTIRRPSVTTGSEAHPRRATQAGGPERPPIVLIVLDAARVDHFGIYGYERDTTPHIDALAADALVFKNAVAECSYTLCSMPSLLSGLSYVQHGMVTKQLVLKDEVETLAETLHRAGYFNLGYTGNPNNSRITGTHQGFDELYEIWKTHPKHITGQVMERLRQGDLEDRPFFLMLHYVPPHEPYAPDPEHDVFGDPGYDGPVTSDREFTRAVYSQKVILDDADLFEMVALYDGNLRMGDATVGRIVTFLKESGLYDDALVIVTSDHGEAFLEHGRVGHNTTIYDEMLRVPLLVKLPAAWADRAAGVDLERLVTLSDVPATLLGLLGLELPAEVRAFDLLAANGQVPERVIYLRSAHAGNPILGVRTRRFKALTRAGRPPEIYDLLADPHEEDNRIVDNAVLHTGLSLILARAIREPETLRAGMREGEISEEDQAMLRALGYL